jgi:enterochelin esterase-like enzyme
MWKRSWKRLQGSGHCGTVVSVLSTTRNEAFADGGPDATIRDSLYSAALGQRLDYLIHWPPRRATGDRRLPTLYLLHGRGEQMISWLPFFDRLDESVRAGLIAPILAIAPDAPWSDRASWYVDSQFTDAADPGFPVETALTTDLIAHVDRVYPAVPDRSARVLAGYSMGGAGALRLALAHQPMFGAAIAVSPAVYVPLPPRGSNARSSGAFGRGRRRFDAARYRELSYDALLNTVDPALPVEVFIGAGDSEYPYPDPRDARHDMPIEVARLHGRLSRVRGVSTHLRIYGGGHDWSTWWPALLEGLGTIANPA